MVRQLVTVLLLAVPAYGQCDEDCNAWSFAGGMDGYRWDVDNVTPAAQAVLIPGEKLRFAVVAGVEGDLPGVVFCAAEVVTWEIGYPDGTGDFGIIPLDMLPICPGESVQFPEDVNESPMHYVVRPEDAPLLTVTYQINAMNSVGQQGGSAGWHTYLVASPYAAACPGDKDADADCDSDDILFVLEHWADGFTVDDLVDVILGWECQVDGQEWVEYCRPLHPKRPRFDPRLLTDTREVNPYVFTHDD